MKTALKDLIEKLQKFRLIKEDENSYELFRQLEYEAELKEKEQIIDAHKRGSMFNGWALEHEHEQYYSQNYNQNQNNSFNEFFGVQGEKVFEPVQPAPQFKKKKFLSSAIYCNQHKFFSDRVLTETGQKSYILLDEWEWAEFFKFANFLCDLNTPTDSNLSVEQNSYKAIDGNNMYGLWLSMRLVGDPAFNNAYCEIFGVTIDAFISEKTG